VDIERIAHDDATPLGVGSDPTPQELLADPLHFDLWRLKTLIQRHAMLTNSSRAEEILANFDEYLPRFFKVVPQEFRRALTQAADVAVAVGTR
jgi:glutamate synthase (NADPH/NADH) large chain